MAVGTFEVDVVKCIFIQDIFVENLKQEYGFRAMSEWVLSAFM
jgi:hypothetical protein